ncbi:MAG: hypothetical protein ACRD4M_14655, partial [Candidatus Acidiferrales bacterium]
ANTNYAAAKFEDSAAGCNRLFLPRPVYFQGDLAELKSTRDFLALRRQRTYHLFSFAEEI